MCMEDIRIGRATASRERTENVTAVRRVIFGQDAKRTRIIVDNHGPNDAFLSSMPDATSGQGIRITALDQPQILTVEDYGVWITGPIGAVCAAAQTAVLGIVECSLEKT